MGEFGIMHWMVVLVVLLLFFGPSKLPQLGQSLGRAIRGFKEGINELNGEARDLPPKKEDSTAPGQQIRHEQASHSEQKQPETSSTEKKS